MVRHVWFAMLVVTVAFGLSATAADSMTADQQAISNIEKEWTEAVKNRNKAFYEKYMSDDFTYISEEGGVPQRSSRLHRHGHEVAQDR